MITGKIYRVINRILYELHQLVFYIIKDRRTAHFSESIVELHRTDAHLAMTLSELGTVHMSKSRIKKLGSYMDPVSYARFLRRHCQNPGPDTIYISDRKVEPPAGSRHANVSYDYYSPKQPGKTNLFYPYVLHPWMYASGFHKKLCRLRNTKKTHRLFFSGTINDGYSSGLPFPISSRTHIINFLINNFATDICLVDNKDKIKELKTTDKPIIVVLFHGSATASATNHFIGREQYMNLIAGSFFAVCPPGGHMPHSHNLIEAMSVGTIPLTNYGAFCRPPLAHGETCLGFSSDNELRAAVRFILDTPSNQFETMQNNVSRQYDQFLSPEGFALNVMADFFEDMASEKSIVFNHEWLSPRLWEKSVNRSSDAT